MDLTTLTRMPEKAALYARDVYFREGLRDAARTWGPEWQTVLHRAALLMIKPDGLFAGVLPAVLDHLARARFDVVAARAVSLAGPVWRAMWWYQLTAASTDRFLLNDLKYRDPGLVLQLRRRDAGGVPAVVALSRRKGSSEPTRQAPDTLRARIGQPHRTFTYIHVPDEPADMLREIAVLTADGGREEMLRAFLQDTLEPRDRQLLEDASARPPATDPFNLEAALDRLEQALAAASLCSTVAEQLGHALRSIRARRPTSWQGFVELAAQSSVAFEAWDLATAGAHAIALDDPGVPKAIGSPADAAWGSG